MKRLWHSLMCRLGRHTWVTDYRSGRGIVCSPMNCSRCGAHIPEKVWPPPPRELVDRIVKRCPEDEVDIPVTYDGAEW